MNIFIFMGLARFMTSLSLTHGQLRQRPLFFIICLCHINIPVSANMVHAKARKQVQKINLPTPGQDDIYMLTVIHFPAQPMNDYL